jgi:hypothetical protein
MELFIARFSDRLRSALESSPPETNGTTVYRALRRLPERHRPSVIDFDPPAAAALPDNTF